MQGLEQCDDGNTAHGDGCSGLCTLEGPVVFCGDGLIQGLEQCDDGNQFNGDGCNAFCLFESPISICGDGVVDAPEECDDGNLLVGDGCDALCRTESVGASCGDGSGRQPVSGEVSFNGEPIDEGSITFVPLEGDGIKTGGPIVDGRYEIEGEKGPPLGKHKVILRWEKKTGKTYTDPETGETFPERDEGLPAVYWSEDSPLEVEIVKGENTYDFHETTE